MFVRSVSVLEVRLQLCGACVKLGYFQLVTSFPSLENLLKSLSGILLFKRDFHDPRCGHRWFMQYTHNLYDAHELC